MSDKTHTQIEGWPDIHPKSSLLGWQGVSAQSAATFSIDNVAPIVGLQPIFIKKVFGSRTALTLKDIETLVLLDDASETFVPRSHILGYFERAASQSQLKRVSPKGANLDRVICGDAHKLIPTISDGSVDCVVTSTPYWGVRIYGTPKNVEWADGEICPFGHEQTPEGFIRHSVDILFLIKSKVASHGSVW